VNRREGRLGRNYAKLWTASVVSNLGDGVDSAALPLLAEALTRDPLLFAGVAVASRLPWLLLSLHAGAIADRVDRRRLMVASNLARFVLMSVLGVAVVTDTASIWLLYVVALGLGSFEVLFDNAAQTIMPSVITREQLERGNGRLFAGEIITNQFAGPPLGALLFGITAALPILLDAGTFLVSAGLIAAMTGSYRSSHARIDRSIDLEARPAADTTAALDRDVVAEERVANPATGPAPGPAAGPHAPSGPPRRRLRTEIREGLAWLWQHRLLRTLAILLAAMNGTTMMGMSIFTLYVYGDGSVLGLDPIGYGLLLLSAAGGSLLGGLAAERLVPRVGRGPALWLTLLTAVAAPLSIGLTSRVWVVVAAQVVFGFGSVVWNVVTVSLRQSIIPDELLGRVNSVYRFLGWGAMPVGSLLGGLIAAGIGLRATFLAAAALMACMLLVGVRTITSAEIAGARNRAAAP
jgi:MFS family permease